MFNFKGLNKKTNRIIDITIILITFICFIQMLIFTLISFYNSTKTEIKLKENNLKQYTNEYKNSLDEYFEYNFEILEYLSKNPKIYNMNWEEQYDFLRKQEESLKFEHFIVVDLEGNGYYENRNEIKDQSTEEFFKDVINNERFITEPFMEIYEKRSIVTLSVSIYKNYEKVGALCGVIDLSKIYKKFENKKIGYEGYSFLINNEGTYIAHRNNNFVFNRYNFFDKLDLEENSVKEIKEKINDNNEGVVQIVLDDREYYASFTTLDANEWKLLIVVPKIEFLYGIKYITKYQILTFIFGILFIFLAKRSFDEYIKNRKLVYIDSLTSINNRASIDNMLKSLEEKYSVKITIICFDLNDFKYINDTYGHHIGDELLKIYANILNKVLGNIGFVGRMGGDEFIAILMDINNSQLQEKFDEINDIIEQYNSKTIYHIKIYYGYATREVGDIISLNDIYKEADKNMYDFKKKCKNNNLI